MPPALDTAAPHLTQLGAALGAMPLHPRFGRMLFLAALLGALGPITTVAAAGRSIWGNSVRTEGKSTFLSTHFICHFDDDAVRLCISFAYFKRKFANQKYFEDK